MANHNIRFEKHPAEGTESSRFCVIRQGLDSDGYLRSTDVDPPEIAGWLICYGPRGWYWQDANLAHGPNLLGHYLDDAMTQICEMFHHQPESMP